MFAAPGRPGYHHGDLRHALLVTATALGRENGPAAVTVREAARRIGVSPSAAYRHFAGQLDLLTAVATVALQELAARMRAAVAAVPNSEDQVTFALARFRAVGLAYVGYALDVPGLFRTAYSVGVALTDPVAVAGPMEADHPQLILAEVLDDLVAAGALAPERRENAEVAAWSGVHGVAVLILDGVLGDAATDPRPLIDSTLDMIGVGLCAPALFGFAAGSAR